jgi:tol-pal system protein YbgF
MSVDAPKYRINSFLTLLPALAAALSLYAVGCGTIEETSNDWQTTPAVSATARLEYRIDSLTNENRRYRQQVEALATENRSLTARNAELETKINEMTTAPPKAEVLPKIVTPKVEAAPKKARTSTSARPTAPTYEDALATVRDKKDYAAAIDQFDALLQGGIKEDLQDNCHFWMGHAYYQLKKYNDALRHFGMVLGYKDSEKKPDAQLMIAKTYLATGNRTSAKEAFDKVISAYPSSPQAKSAQEGLSHLK